MALALILRCPGFARSKSVMWCAAFACLCACVAATAPAQTAPKVAMVEGHPRLVAPPGLQKAIEQTFPGYRFPLDSEIVGRWKRNISETSVPYATWGDYDGDGLIDVGIVVLNESHWKFAIFNQASPSQYKVMYMRNGTRDETKTSSDAPEGITLLTVPKGEPIEVWTRGKKGVKTYNHDVIQFTQLDDEEDKGGVEIFNWGSSGYEIFQLTGD